MIPPLLLAVEAGHAVLDMCASPGSKTAQLLEALHTGEVPAGTLAALARASLGDDAAAVVDSGAGGLPAPSGYIVANDVDPKRAYMLTHQTNRLGSLSLVVTCHDASQFPRLALAEGAGGAGAVFDRVLCDVPCSGDGTARKNGDVLPRWTPSSGNSLHPLQVSIAMRGLQVLRVGGLMAYSTCSFNPVENEAVVAELLRRAGGAAELVDCADRLPGLVRSPGMRTWLVHDHATMTPWHDWPSVVAASAAVRERSGTWRGVRAGDAAAAANPAPPPLRGADTPHFNWAGAGEALSRLTPSMLPQASNDALHLERCLRLLPHAQDTGGFFVALIRKTAPLPVTAVIAPPTRTDATLPEAPPLSGTKRPREAEDDGAAAATAAAAAAAAEVDDDDEAAAGDDDDEEGEGAELEAAAEEEAAVAAAAAAVDDSAAAAAATTAVADVATAVAAPPLLPLPARAAGEARQSASSLSFYFNVHAGVRDPLYGFYGIGCAPAPPACPASAWTAAASAAAAAAARLPDDRLWFRGDNGRTIVVVNGALARTVLPQAHVGARGAAAVAATGGVGAARGAAVRIISTGLKIFEAAPESFVAAFGGGSAATPATAAAAVAPEGAPAAPPPLRGVMTGYGVQTPYRLCAEGALYALPFLAQQVAYVSGRELARLLAERGTQVPLTALSPRLGRVLGAAVEVGAVAVVLCPALDGTEEDAGPDAYPASAAAFHRCYAVDAAARRVLPRAALRAEDAHTLPPAMQAHYADAPLTAAAGTPPDGRWLHLRPDPSRLYRSASPLAGAVAVVWLSRGKVGLMLAADDTVLLRRLLDEAGYGTGGKPLAAPVPVRAPAAAAPAAAAPAAVEATAADAALLPPPPPPPPTPLQGA